MILDVYKEQMCSSDVFLFPGTLPDQHRSANRLRDVDHSLAHAETMKFSAAKLVENYPGKRPKTVCGAKGYETSGGDEDDDTQM